MMNFLLFSLGMLALSAAVLVAFCAYEEAYNWWKYRR